MDLLSRRKKLERVNSRSREVFVKRTTTLALRSDLSALYCISGLEDEQLIYLHGCHLSLRTSPINL